MNIISANCCSRRPAAHEAARCCCWAPWPYAFLIIIIIINVSVQCWPVHLAYRATARPRLPSVPHAAANQESPPLSPAPSCPHPQIYKNHNENNQQQQLVPLQAASPLPAGGGVCQPVGSTVCRFHQDFPHTAIIIIRHYRR